MTSAGANEMLLNDPPTDGISSVCFAPASDLLLASSWDSVRVQRRKSDGGCARGVCCKAVVTRLQQPFLFEL